MAASRRQPRRQEGDDHAGREEDLARRRRSRAELKHAIPTFGAAARAGKQTANSPDGSKATSDGTSPKMASSARTVNEEAVSC